MWNLVLAGFRNIDPDIWEFDNEDFLSDQRHF